VALGEIGDATAVEALVKVLQKSPIEDEEFLRRAVARAIGQIAETTLQKEFLAQSEIKNYDTYIKENRKNLSSKYPSLRSSIGVLIQVLQNSKESDDAKRETAFALGAIGDGSATAVLTSKLAAEDYYLAEISRAALAKISSL
jgi:HEAT repeat protein